MVVYPVTELNLPELSIYNERAESRLLHYNEPQPGLFIAETPMVIRRALDAGYEPVSMLGETNLIKKQKQLTDDLPPNLPVYAGSDEILREIAGYHLARGLLCAMKRKPLPPQDAVLEGATRVVVLDRIMNPTNIGAIFRSAAAFGMDCVLLTRGCTDPLYRRAARVSVGNVFMIPWTFARDNADTPTLIEQLKAQGFQTAAMALSEDAAVLGETDLSAVEKLAVVMGSESEGIAKDTLDVCDMTIRIPMQNGVDSLNVAAASAVAFWELSKGALA